VEQCAVWVVQTRHTDFNEGFFSILKIIKQFGGQIVWQSCREEAKQELQGIVIGRKTHHREGSSAILSLCW